ncbi:MAG: lactate utilization protein [Coriobacteriia bacterium]|nr:lactate utilization protein [Coriobacteriia bacterium]
MNEETIRAFEFKRNEMRAQKVIKGLKSRKMNGYYAANREEALKIALELIPEGSEVNMGGCMSAHQIGLFDTLKNGPYNFVDRDDTDDRRAAMLAAFDADVFLASANAITEDGIMVNIDGAANRIAALAFGPRKLVHIVGMNKVCADVHDAIKRARNVAAPINAQRFGLSTPCSKTGACGDCKSEDCICCQMLITRFAMDPDRVHVILVNEDLGF